MKYWGWGAENKQFDLTVRPKAISFLNKKFPNAKREHYPFYDIKDVALKPAVIHSECLQALNQCLRPDQIALDAVARINFTYGRSYRDIYRMRIKEFSCAPDVVVFPENDQDVLNIIQAAQQYQCQVIPYGGGTNIVGSVERMPGFSGMVITVAMQRMNKVLEIDTASDTAVIQAGATGRELEQQLNAKGYTLGHFPDSFEYSTLGGWIVTRSSGMQSDKNGDIENMLINLTCITPTGIINTPAVPRASVGQDINQIVLGSEGMLGIVTQARVSVKKNLPKHTTMILFPSFAVACQVIHHAHREGFEPPMMRLVDANELDLSSSLRITQGWLKDKIAHWSKEVIFKYQKYDSKEIAALLVTLEGGAQQINKDKKYLRHLCKLFDGFNVGFSAGEEWYANKYEIPYIRDEMLSWNVISDVGETAVLWEQVVPLYQDMISKVRALFAAKDEGAGFVGCHLSHTYNSGICLYFTFARDASLHADNLQAYDEIKRLVTDTILEHGGALSHHHAVGYEHLTWVQRYLDKPSIAVMRGIKQTLDPNGIMNPGKLLPPESSEN